MLLQDLAEFVQNCKTEMIAITTNIILGMYYNIRINKVKFDWKILVIGVVKALIITGAFIGLGFCFYQMDLTSIGISPETIMSAAIILYVTKGCITLSKILCVDNTMKK